MGALHERLKCGIRILMRLGIDSSHQSYTLINRQRRKAPRFFLHSAGQYGISEKFAEVGCKRSIILRIKVREFFQNHFHAGQLHIQKPFRLICQTVAEKETADLFVHSRLISKRYF